MSGEWRESLWIDELKNQGWNNPRHEATLSAKKKSFSRENRTRMNFPSLLCSFHGKVEQERVDYVWTCNTLKLHLMDEVMVNNCELWKYPCIIRMKNDAGWRETERSGVETLWFLSLVVDWLRELRATGRGQLDIVYSHHSTSAKKKEENRYGNFI